MKTLTIEQWKEKGKELFGDDMKYWEFKCSNCGHVQSVKSVLIHNNSLDVEKIKEWITCNCEGRYTEGIGCNWSLFGLLHNHTLEVIYNGKNVPCFEFVENNT